MSGNVIIPRHYLSKLELLETEVAIKAAKDTFEAQLSAALGLTRVSAPLFVRPESGLNDDLNGVERPVQFDILDVDGAQVQIVQSLAKWKRMALAAYGFGPGTGLYTDMNAIRRDELLDNLHSVYVDQWDWELVITPQQRNRDFLREKVTRLWQVFTKSQQLLCRQFPQLSRYFPESITFVSTQELEERWPEKTPREREDAIAKEHGAVFLMGIGGTLSSGAVHDGRAPDYDDWSLNGDILIWYPVLERVLRLIVGTWEGDINSFTANIFNAVAKLVVTYGDALSEELFINRVGNLSIKQLTRMAKDRRPGSMGYAETMVIEYNGKKKNQTGRLLIGALYARENARLDHPEET